MNRYTTALVTGALLLVGCTEAEDRPGRTARGSASGAAGPQADSLMAVDRSADAAADSARSATDGTNGRSRDGSAAAADTSWTAGVTDVNRESARLAVQQSLRVAAQDGFDRMVFDFGDDDLPGYHVEYIDRPVRACGSGEVVELPGDGWLSVQLRPAAAHDEDGSATVDKRDVPAGLPNIQRVRATCDFEGIVEWVAAVRAPNAYRVLELQSPSRIVVDVRH